MTKLVISVRFLTEASGYRTASRKTYDYFYEGDIPVEAEDFAIVNSPYGGYVVTVVTDVRAALSTDSLKFAEGVVSKSEQRRKEAARARKAELRKKLKERVTQAHEEALYEQLAITDPTAAAMLKELRTLEG